MTRAMVVAIVIARAGLAVADEVPPYEPVRKPPPVATPAPPPAVVVEEPAPAPPPRRSLELAFTFPVSSRVTGAPFETRGQSFALDVIARRELGGGLDVGAVLGVVDWRNYETSYRGGMNHVVDVRVVARRAFGAGAFRPFVQLGAGVGLSVVAPEFTVYDLPGYGGTQGTTRVDGRVGVAYLGEAVLGFRRVLADRWEVVGELALHGAIMRHHVVFTDDTGVTSRDGLGLRELDARVGVAYAF